MSCLATVNTAVGHLVLRTAVSPLQVTVAQSAAAGGDLGARLKLTRLGGAEERAAPVGAGRVGAAPLAQGLSREVETLSSLLPIWSRKWRRLRWRMLQGPS